MAAEIFLGGNFFVHDVEAKSRAGALNLGDLVGDLLDALDLLVEVVGLQEVTEVGVVVIACGGVQVEQGLVHSLFKLEGRLHGLKGCTPLHLVRLGDVEEDDLSTSVGLVLHQLHAVFALLIRGLLEVRGEPVQSLFITVKPGAHGQVDVAGVELHVDLLVKQGLGILVEILSDSGSHLDLEST